MTVTLVVLAAGESSRLGRPKQLVPFQGKPLLVRAVETALAVGEAIVVLGAHEGAIAPFLAGHPVRTVHNPRWATGMGSSIAAGVAAAGDADAVLLMLCDQPGLTADHLRALVSAWNAGHPLACSTYDGARGVPAIFDRAIFPELLALDGSPGAKAVITKDPDRVATLPFEQGRWDVDTEADVAALERVSGA